MTLAAPQLQRQEIEAQRFEAYQNWERLQHSDPRFASLRMLLADVRDYDTIRPETWERFDLEERTWGAEVLNAPHSHIDRFRFDGQDIIVKESNGLQPQITLREVYQNGLDRSREEAAIDPDLEFQVQRDELFLEFYESIEQMMRGETAYDTIHMISTCPVPSELSDDPKEAARLMQAKYYDAERRKSFDYTARRLPNGQLELSATTLDSSNLEAHAKVLQASGYANVNFALTPSHYFGKFLSYDNTTTVPIELVIAARASIYDAELEAQTGRPHRYGRDDDTIDAHKFFEQFCDDYWAGYKAYHELLAEHLSGKDIHEHLRNYLSKCLSRQERVGQSVLSEDKLIRLRTQLASGKITADMAMSCRELLVYDHHATLSRLLKHYKETGTVPRLQHASGDDLMGAYADTASSNGADAAALGETFAGCETATGVSGLAGAAQAAAAGKTSLEQSLRAQEEEAMHCLRIQLYGYTIRKNVLCPFCDNKVDAKDTERSIVCLDAGCGVSLNKATGEIQYPNRPEEAKSQEVPQHVPRLHTGQVYLIGKESYRRELRAVVGGAEVMYIDTSGQHITGLAAEHMDAAISQQLAVESRAA